SQLVEVRAAELGIDPVIQGAAEKMPAYRELLRAGGWRPGQVCYVGDDVPDLPVLCNCGLAVAVADAAPEVLAAAHYVARAPGGLPALPERYWPREEHKVDHPITIERPVEVKLQQAFGTGCQELKMPIQVESPRGVVIASKDCTFERGGREVRLTPVSMAFFKA